MVSIADVGIPRELASPEHEDVQLYILFYDLFLYVFDFDLSGLIMESDQGSALTAVWRIDNNQQLLCLRYFMISLKRNSFARKSEA
jgi:hypothetical protein